MNAPQRVAPFVRGDRPTVRAIPSALRLPGLQKCDHVAADRRIEMGSSLRWNDGEDSEPSTQHFNATGLAPGLRRDDGAWGAPMRECPQRVAAKK